MNFFVAFLSSTTKTLGQLLEVSQDRFHSGTVQFTVHSLPLIPFDEEECMQLIQCY